MRAITSLTAVGLLLGLWCDPARAENPRVHLKLEKVTAAEAAAALAFAANAHVALVVPQRPDPRLLERLSFDWSDITLANALRQLVDRYSLQVHPFAGSYTLFFTPAPARAPAYQNLVEKNGVRVFLHRISVSTAHNINFDGAGGVNSGNLSLSFGAELGARDAEAVIGLDNVSARDDQGNVLTPDHPTLGLVPTPSLMPGQFPDEWSGGALLPPPHPRAKKLLWVEGELVGYRVYRRHPLELPISEQGKPREFQGGTVELSRVETSPTVAAGKPETQDVRVEVRISLPPGQLLTADRVAPVRLIGKSGRTYPSSGGGMNSSGGPNGTRMQYDARFIGVGEPVERVEFVTVEASDPQPIITFRMTDVPLPVPAPMVSRRAVDPRPIRVPNGPVRKNPFPFRQEQGGGTLMSTVSVANRPVPEGVLSLGLAAQESGEWGPIRWMDVEVTAEGVARLEQLKPGAYRLVQVFRTTMDTLPLPPGGMWQNTEVEVGVEAGKETRVPPLVWVVPAPPGQQR